MLPCFFFLTYFVFFMTLTSAISKAGKESGINANHTKRKRCAYSVFIDTHNVLLFTEVEFMSSLYKGVLHSSLSIVLLLYNLCNTSRRVATLLIV